MRKARVALMRPSKVTLVRAIAAGHTNLSSLFGPTAVFVQLLLNYYCHCDAGDCYRCSTDWRCISVVSKAAGYRWAERHQERGLRCGLLRWASDIQDLAFLLSVRLLSEQALPQGS